MFHNSTIQRLPFSLLITAVTLVLILQLCHVSSYAPRPLPRRSRLALSAWSMPSPSFATASFTPTWYNEVPNPTARRTEYDDVPLEYTFVTPSDTWPSSSDLASLSKKTEEPSREGPLRRAAKWVRGRF